MAIRLRTGLALPGVRVDEHGVEAVAHRPPAVLGDHVGRMGRKQVVGAQPQSQRGDQRLAERHERGAVVDERLGVGEAKLERPQVGARPEIPPEVVRSGKSPPAAPQETKASKSCQVAKTGGVAARERSSTSFSRVEASPESAPLEERRVRGQRGELGHVAASRVVDGERLVGVPEPDVDVEPAREPAGAAPRDDRGRSAGTAAGR